MTSESTVFLWSVMPNLRIEPILIPAAMDLLAT